MNRTDGVGHIDPRPGVMDVPLLTAAEEKQLAVAIARGDKEAKDRMILANLGLVAKLARGYLGRGLMLDDLIGEGNLGLIRAAEEFDPAFDVRFSTYAAYWIKEAIRHALINTTATIRIPAHMIGLMTKVRRTERQARRDGGPAPAPEEVADRVGLTGRQKALAAAARRAADVKFESSFADGARILASAVSGRPQGSPSAALEAEEERRALRANLEVLDDRERAILRYRYGLGGEEPTTQREAGRRVGVTREWARKLEIRALGKLGARQTVVACAR